MGKDCVSVENTYSTKIFLRARRWTAIGVGAYRDHTAIDPLSTARDPTSTKRRAVFFTARLFLYHMWVCGSINYIVLAIIPLDYLVNFIIAQLISYIIQLTCQLDVCLPDSIDLVVDLGL
jgi:hypothetical protein